MTARGTKENPEFIERRRQALLGKKRTLEQRTFFSQRAKENGIGKWMKDRPKSEAHKQAIARAHLGKPKLGNRGAGNVNWFGGVSAQHKTIRNVFMQTLEYKNWRRSVFERDNYTCQACGQRGGDLVTDHELPFALFPALRTELLNGRVLCVPCHKKTYAPISKLQTIHQLN